MAESTRSALLPAPQDDPITWNGQTLSPGLILRLSRRAMSQRKRSRGRIFACRSLRRMDDDSLVTLNPAWVAKNPEAAGWVREVLEQRITLERDLIARIGKVEPEYDRKPEGHRKTEGDLAEECEAYLEEWRRQNVPIRRMSGKLVEDGEFALLTLPAHLDMDGCPDFFEMLDERAYGALPDERKGEYKRSETDRRKRYVRVDADGAPKRNPRFDTGDDDEAHEAHDEAVRAYLLATNATASNVRIVPALDCAPVFVRGKANDAWELRALVERTLYYPEDAIAEGYGWRGMGDRLLVPLAYEADGSRMTVSEGEIGEQGQIYKYTAYLVCKDAQGRQRPISISTMGGTATWDSVSGNADDPESVMKVDYYEAFKTTGEDGREHGLEGPLWSYHGGLGTDDDNPDHAWQPYMWAFYHRIRALEGVKTAINATTAVSAYTGYFEPIDPRFGEGDLAEAMLDADGGLKRTRMPAPGEIEPTLGPGPVPAQQARVGEDAWRVYAADMASLQQATAVDQAPTGGGPSGYSMVVQETIAQVTKADVREGTRAAVISAGEKHLKILAAVERKYGVRWPIQTVEERPVGEELREGVVPAAFDPAWIGDGRYTLKAEYPEEESLARIDLESALVLKGQSTIKRLAKAMGEKDTTSFRAELLKDKLHAMPETVIKAGIRLAKLAGDRDMQKLLELRQAQMMAPVDVPGVPNGVPAGALRGQGERMAARPSGQGQAPIASSIRGGIEAAEQGAATLQANAEAAMTGGGA